MLVTENEASQKVCIKMAVAIVALPQDRKNAALVADGQNCIGSRCMAWNWHDSKMNPKPGETWIVRRGFCGLAGRGAP